MGGKMPRAAGKNCRRRQALHAASYRPGPIIPPNQLLASAPTSHAIGTAAPVRLFGGFQVEGEAAKITRYVPTLGRLPNGTIIEREIELTLATLGQLRLSPSNPDFTTAKRIAIAVNEYIGALRWSERAASCPSARQAPCHAIALVISAIDAGGCRPRRDVPACRQKLPSAARRRGQHGASAPRLVTPSRPCFIGRAQFVRSTGALPAEGSGNAF
jgi:hypothetical protein